MQDLFGADIFSINNKHYLGIVGYHNKIPVIKQVARSFLQEMEFLVE